MPSIDRDSVFRPQLFLADPEKNFILKTGYSFAGHARNSQRFRIFPIVVLGQITFVQDNDFIPVNVALLKVRRTRSIMIGNVQTQISVVQRTLGPRDSFPFKLGCRRPEAGSVKQPKRNSAEVDGFLDCVASCAVRLAHNDALVAQ